MASINNLENFKSEYLASFDVDWVENLNWSNPFEAQNSWDFGNRLISDFRRTTFIHVAQSLLCGEYIEAEEEVAKIHSALSSYWVQEHLAVEEQNPQINNLKTKLMANYESLDKDLRYLFDEYGMLLRAVKEKFSTKPSECIFNATTYHFPHSTEWLNYVDILCHQIIPICLFEHKLPNGLDNIRELVRIHVIIDKAIQQEVNQDCISILKIVKYKTSFLLMKTLPRESEYVYFLDNIKYTVSRSTLELPPSMNGYIKSFLSFNEDDSHDSDNIRSIQHKCVKGNATIQEYITLFDYYRKFAKQQIQLDNILQEFKAKYDRAVSGLQDGFNLYAWRTMLNYLYNCRLSYLLNRRKKKPTFDELKQYINEIDSLQQDTYIHNFYPYKKTIEYLILLIKNDLQKRTDANYSERLELLNELIINYEYALDWCKASHFYPIQLPSDNCYVDGLDKPLMVPSTFSKPIDYDKQYDALTEFKSELRFINESLQMIEQTKELNSLREGLRLSEKKYIEIGGIFISAITFLFGTINIFTNDKASPLQMFISTIGLGVLLVIFAALLILVVSKRDWTSFKTWGLTAIIIGYSIILCCIIWGGNSFYEALSSTFPPK